MGKIETGNKTVDRIYEITHPKEDTAIFLYEGHIMPRGWFRSLTTDYGQPDFPAILILGEIMCWYRPSDKRNGKTVPWHKQFDDNKLQVGYEDYAKRLGMTKRQVQAAVLRLSKNGIITIEYRNGVISSQGVLMNNVIYIEPVLSKVLEISKNEIYVKSDDGSKIHITRKRVIPHTRKRETNT